MSENEKKEMKMEDKPAMSKKSKMPIWKKVLIGAALFFGIMLIYGYFTLSGVNKAADMVMDNLIAQDCGAIYEDASTVFTGATTTDNWDVICKQYTEPMRGGTAERTSTAFSAETGQAKVGTAYYTVTDSEGGTYPVAMQFQDQDGWKLSAISFDPADQVE